MGIWTKIRGWFNNSEILDLHARITFLQLTIQTQASILEALVKEKNDIENINKDLQALFVMTANAVQNLDSKGEQADKLSAFLYEKIIEHENKIVQLEEKADIEDLKQLTLKASEKSPEN